MEDTSSELDNLISGIKENLQSSAKYMVSCCSTKIGVALRRSSWNVSCKPR